MNGDTTITATVAHLLTPEERRHWRLAWLSTVDHKRIGVLYMVTGLVFFVIAGIEALLIRLQLMVPNNTLLGPDTYNWMFTMHGTTMIFLVAMPVLFGIMNYILPLQIGARDMAFPRLNALGVWLVPFGGILLHFSFLAGGPPTVGWFAYTPLSEAPYSSQLGVDYWAISLLVLGIGSVSAGINFIVTGLHSARAGHDAAPASVIQLDDFHERVPGHPGAAYSECSAGDVADRSIAGRQVFSAVRRRLSDHVAAYFLGLRSSGSLYRRDPGVCDSIGSDSGFLTQTDFWPRVRRRFDGGHRHAELVGVGAPHVYGGARAHCRSVLCRGQCANRCSNWREAVQLERDDGRRPACVSLRRCFSALQRCCNFS